MVPRQVHAAGASAVAVARTPVWRRAGIAECRRPLPTAAGCHWRESSRATETRRRTSAFGERWDRVRASHSGVDSLPLLLLLRQGGLEQDLRDFVLDVAELFAG